jgi:hypothetical protein
MCGIGALAAVSGMLLTWRFLVCGLWIGLAGSPRLFVGSAVAFIFFMIALVVSDPTEWPGWLLDNPARLTRIVWIAAAAVVAKSGIAAYAWRRVAPQYARAYLMVWFGATASFVALAIVVLGIARVYVPAVAERLWSLAILAALMAVPLARIGLATSQLTRNRHR